MATTDILTTKQTTPTIYAYITPNDHAKDGWIKIGYTDRDAETRIREQTHTADTKYEILWSHDARYDGGDYFTDSDFHWYLVQNGISRGTHGDTGKPSEWFDFGVGNEHRAKELFKSFVFQDYSGVQGSKDEKQYRLRTEQAEAVEQTLAYLKAGAGKEFLWNAKPRFGKTLAAYDFARKGNFSNVLIVTNRPAIANSWYDDFSKFIRWQEPDFLFVSETDALKGTNSLSREKYKEITLHSIGVRECKQIAIVSLQDLKGSLHFGGPFDKLEWVASIEWDLLIVDEAHEGVDTSKTEAIHMRLYPD
jgi:type II restriction enzyme